MPLIQLQPHPFTSLPAHPLFPPEGTRPDLQEYTRSAFHEALELLSSVPSAFTADPKPRPSPPSKSKVKLFRRWRKPAEQEGCSRRKPEFWVCRQSEHVDAKSTGTASWPEFEEGLRHQHAEHEMEYTPTVSGVKRLLQWDNATIKEVEVDGVKFTDVLVEGKSFGLRLWCDILSHLDLSRILMFAISSQPDNPYFPPKDADITTLVHFTNHLS